MTVRLLVNDLVKVSIWCTDAEQASVNRLWYLITSVGAPAATDADMATELDVGFLDTAIPPMLNNNALYNGVQCQIYRNPGPGQTIFRAQFSIAGSAAGTGGALALPRQSAGITRWLTPQAGRAYRGRSYWPFPSTAHDVGNGNPTSAYSALVTTLSNGLFTFTNITGSGTALCDLVLMHKKNKAGVTPPPTVMQGALVEGRWATQRRRGSFGRPNISPI
jgi:hypothetical protein